MSMKQPTDKSAYESIALKMLPPGHPPSVVLLRARIAEALEREVTAALLRQQEQAFPDLQKSRQELDQLRRQCLQEDETVKKRHRAKQEELARLDERLKNLERALQAKEAKLNILMDAFERYLAWLDGEGEVDENGKRFNALREAHRTYKEKT